MMLENTRYRRAEIMAGRWRLRQRMRVTRAIDVLTLIKCRRETTDIGRSIKTAVSACH